MERLPLILLGCFMYKCKSLQEVQLTQEHLSFVQNLSSFKMPRYLYPPAPALPISFPFGSWIPSHLVFLPLCSDTATHFKIPNTIFISSLHYHTVLIKESIPLSSFPYSFKSSMKNRWLTFAPFFSCWYPHSCFSQCMSQW